jgi:hypothetical protein
LPLVVRPKEEPEFFTGDMPLTEFRSRLGIPDEYSIVIVTTDWTDTVKFTMTKRED